MRVIKENNGKLLDASTLELVGDWFEVDNIIYYVPLSND